MLRWLTYRFPDGRTRLNVRGIWRVAMMLLRGLPWSVLLRRPVLMGPRAHIESGMQISGKGILKIEQDVLLQATSEHGLVLGQGVSFGAYSQIRPSSQYGGLLGQGCTIESGTAFGPHAYIGCAGTIRIGRNCMFGPSVSLIAENHVVPGLGESIKEAGTSRVGITIGDECWFGANVVVLDGSSIGDGAIIGAGAVVRGEIPPHAVAVGVPAKVVRKRHSSETK